MADDRVPGKYVLNARLADAEVYNLHWVLGLVDPLPFFTRLRHGTPLVWTLHDMNPFTGGCHYALDCRRFLAACGCCPQLGSQATADLTAEIHARRRVGYSRLARHTTRIVTPSRWLAAEAQRSSLMGDLAIDVIPNAVDVDVFSPRRKDLARRQFGLPETGPVIAFVADQVDLHLKGFDLLYQALEGLETIPDLTVAIIGRKPEAARGRTGMAWLGRIDDEEMLSHALSAADVFVTPSRADNLPNVLLEAIACGTPVVAFDTGGISDVVRPHQTGLLARPEDVAGLCAGIAKLLADDELRTRMSKICREVAVAEYALEVQARRYINLYEELVEASRAPPPSTPESAWCR